MVCWRPPVVLLVACRYRGIPGTGPRGGDMHMRASLRLMVFATLITHRPDHEHWAILVFRAYKCGMFLAVRWTCKLYMTVVPTCDMFFVTM